jgi:hypothetical protein
MSSPCVKALKSDLVQSHTLVLAGTTLYEILKYRCIKKHPGLKICITDFKIIRSRSKMTCLDFIEFYCRYVRYITYKHMNALNIFK